MDEIFSNLSGEERPITFASRTLTSAEKTYSQIEKEALGIVWGIKHFQMYLYGRHFSLITHHKPLVAIFHPHKGIPLSTAARLQRYTVFISGLDFYIEYRNTKQHGHADGLTTLAVNTYNQPRRWVRGALLRVVFHMSQLKALPVSASEVKRWTAQDPVQCRVYEATMWFAWCLGQWFATVFLLETGGYCTSGLFTLGILCYYPRTTS